MDITYSLMIPVIQYIYEMTHSYGWAIILLTILVRVLVHPLVASSTVSMQRMSQMQPQLKALQDRYKNDPELFQKKAMEFYKNNKINPMGGCLPTLVQLPILFALFATFTGPPFGDKPIPVKVKVVAKAEANQVKRSEVSSATSPYVAKDEKLAKVVVFPGDSTVVEGESITFGVRAVEGNLPADFKPVWRIAQHPQGAEINADGVATFTKPGEYTVDGVIPGIAKNEPFGFIHSLGKTVTGLDLFKPNNWDNLIMIIAFGITMVLTQKLMSPPPNPNADPEQLLIQQQTQRTMPIAVTGMFFFMPLPSGVFLYMVISNVIQSLQTWIVMKSASPLTSPSFDSAADSAPAPVAKKNSKDRAVVNSVTGSQDEIISADEIQEDTDNPSQSKKKSKKKK